jgi:hypothetical protein
VSLKKVQIEVLRAVVKGGEKTHGGCVGGDAGVTRKVWELFENVHRKAGDWNIMNSGVSEVSARKMGLAVATNGQEDANPFRLTSPDSKAEETLAAAGKRPVAVSDFIVVTITQARDLPKLRGSKGVKVSIIIMCFHGLSRVIPLIVFAQVSPNPFIEVCYQSSKKSTQVMEKTQCPTYDERFAFARSFVINRRDPDFRIPSFDTMVNTDGEETTEDADDLLLLFVKHRYPCCLVCKRR